MQASLFRGHVFIHDVNSTCAFSLISSQTSAQWIIQTLLIKYGLTHLTKTNADFLCIRSLIFTLFPAINILNSL